MGVKDSDLVHGFPATLPQLSSTPGWVALNQHEKKWLQEHTSNAVNNFRQSGLRALQSCAELAKIQRFLEGKPMNFTSWIRSSFGASERTAFRWLKSYKEMRGSASDEAILYLAQQGIAGLNSIGYSDVANVIKRLPPPEVSEEKAMEVWRERVGEQLREERRERRRGASKLTPENAQKAFVLTTLRLLRESGLETATQQLAWLRDGVGMVMERRSLHETLKTGPIQVPDGFIPKRGRPRKSDPVNECRGSDSA